MSFEENIRQRVRTTQKAALKEKVEMMKSKMKEKEASQQRKQNIIVMLKPVIFIILIILLIFAFYVFLSHHVTSNEDNVFKEGEADHGAAEEIIVEVDED